VKPQSGLARKYKLAEGTTSENEKKRSCIMVYRFAYSPGPGICCVFDLLVGFYMVQDMDRHVIELSP